MADERTPLIEVVRVAPQRPRYSHHTVRRFCTIALASTLLAIVVLFLIPLRWLPDSTGRSKPWHDQLPHKQWPSPFGLGYDELLQVLMETPDSARARSYSEYYTSGPHLAGKNLSQAVRTMEWWQEFGISAEIVSYDVYLNYPSDHALRLLEKHDDGFKTTFEATLEEDVLDEDPTTQLEDRVPTFHGYSATGNATAPLVFVNFCTYHDFEDLVEADVDLKGKIALCKYGRVFRGLKVKRAQELGMVGVVIYDDPQEDGEVTELNGYKPYPDGPARNPSAVQRGSVQFLSIAPGDPTTPGYPSLPGAPRHGTSGAIPDIPSLPISYREALPFLKALNGHGPKASEFNEYWQGGGLKHKGVEYNIGPSDAHVNLVNVQEYVTTPIWNVIGVINGTVSDEVVIIGNHRDAWLAGGAGDPNSGSAAINEIIRSFGVAMKKGWKPLRTIVFASWDAEEYGLVGSTEWVEEFLPWLSGAAVAYLNMDVGTRGPFFRTAASPLMNKVLEYGLRSVRSPNQTVPGQTVYDAWDKKIATMGSGSDFTAFQDFAGVPCIDGGFDSRGIAPVYHYHSNYDSFYWMNNYGDPEWTYHTTEAKIFAAIIANLLERPVLPLNTTDYATALASYMKKASEKASEKGRRGSSKPFPEIDEAVAGLHAAAVRFDAHADRLSERVAEGVPWWKPRERVKLYRAVRHVNSKLKLFERSFLHQPGLDSRPWFKHIVFAPGLWTGYAGATFPGLLEALDAEDKHAVEKWSAIIENLIQGATASLAVHKE